MPTDQNNGTNPNQNTTTGNVSINPNENQNSGDVNLDLDGVVLEDSPENEENLSADNLFDGGSSVSDESENDTDNLFEKPVADTVDSSVEAPVEQLTETFVEQGVQDVVSQNDDNTEGQVTENSVGNDEDDWLLQEDQAVQESENNESVGQSETVETNNETHENIGVDLSGLADGLESNVEETPVEEASVLPVQEETSEVSNDTNENMGVDLSGLADGLESNVEETPVEEASVSAVQEETSVVNNETNENMGVDLSGLADGLESNVEETPVEEASVLPVQEETVKTNDDIQENMGVDLSGMADVVDNGGTELDSPEIPVETPVAEPVAEQPVAEIPVVETPVAEEVTVEPVTQTPVETINEMDENHEDNGIPADSLTIENVGVPVVENQAGDMVSDTGDFSGKKDAYVPNESEFQKMSNLLDNSKPGQVEIPNEVNTQAQPQGETVQAQEETKGVFNLDYVVSSLQDSEKTRVTAGSQNEVTIQNIDTQNNNVVESASVNNNIPVNNAPENNIPENIVQNTVPVAENVAPVQPVMTQVEVPQNNIPQGQGYVYQPQVSAPMPEVSMQSQVMPVGEMPINQEGQMSLKKSHSGHTGLLIILVVICLLGVAGFILYKMYPDVVGAILGKNNISIEYQNNTSSVVLGDDHNSALTGDILTGEVIEDLTGDVELGDELGEQLLPEENLTGNDELLSDETTQSTGGGFDDVLDPDTLAALLQGNDDESGTEKLGESVTELHNSAIDSGDIDTYKDLGLLLDESNSDKDDVLKKLNDYKAQGIIYQDWGTENDNQGAYKYGTYIVKKATAMIQSIETTGEMDMNELNKIFDTFDGYLSKLESLKSN